MYTCKLNFPVYFTTAETLMEEEEPAENSRASTEEPSSSMMQSDEPLPPGKVQTLSLKPSQK